MCAAVGEVGADRFLAVVGHVLLATLDLAVPGPAPGAFAAAVDAVLVSQQTAGADSVELFSAGELFALVAGLSAEPLLLLLVASPW